MKNFELDSYTFFAENCLDGILISPQLPQGFNVIDISKRESLEIDMWMNRFYIEVQGHENYPSKYSLWCLDSGAWDRPTNYGNYDDLDLAIIAAKRLCK